MAHPNDVNPDDQHLPGFDPETGDVPVEDDGLEEQSPRRAASAQFIVQSSVGSDAALREAMDPANQSLADALRLSFRVLQLVMVVLVVLFFTSGFQTVGDGQSGVLTRWGKIVPVGDSLALSPGLQFSRWPYPIGEFTIFNVENRQVTLRDANNPGGPFWPRLLPRQTLEQATDSAAVHDPPRPRNDGYVLTRDADIAHLRLNAIYEIESPVDFVQRIAEANADRLVELSLQRAAVQVSAEMSLQELIDLSEVLRTQIQERAQTILDEMNCGIRITSVNVTDAIPALAIRRAFGDVQNARVESEQAIARARTQADRTLVRTAGDRHYAATQLINNYEEALQSGEVERSAELLSQINRMFDEGELSGEVATIIQRARSYRSQVESSLGNEARRFTSLLPTFRSHPEMVIRQRWLDTYSRVLSREDAEVWFVPSSVGRVQLEMASLHEIRELRQKLQLDRREQQALSDFARELGGPYLLRGEDMTISGPGRQLRIEDGRVRSLRRD